MEDLVQTNYYYIDANCPKCSKLNKILILGGKSKLNINLNVHDCVFCNKRSKPEEWIKNII